MGLNVEPGYGIPPGFGKAESARIRDEGIVEAHRRKLALAPYEKRLAHLRGISTRLNGAANHAQRVFLDLCDALQPLELEFSRKYPDGWKPRSEEQKRLFEAEKGLLDADRAKREEAATWRDEASAKWAPIGRLVDNCETWLRKNEGRIIEEFEAEQESIDAES